MPEAVIAPERAFAQLLNIYMNKAGISIRALAEKTGSAYEHIRKLTKGEAFPSKGLLHAISQALGLTKAQEMTLHRYSLVDKMKRTYGDVFLELVDKPPGLARFERLWPLLTPEQQEVMTVVLEVLASRQHARGREAKRALVARNDRVAPNVIADVFESVPEIVESSERIRFSPKPTDNAELHVQATVQRERKDKRARTLPNP